METIWKPFVDEENEKLMIYDDLNGTQAMEKKMERGHSYG